MMNSKFVFTKTKHAIEGYILHFYGILLTFNDTIFPGL